MYLNPEQIEKANKKRAVILKHFLDSVRFCNECSGTGLKNFSRNETGDSSWDGVSFCDKCEGLGYLSWKETVTTKLCPTCKGTGGYRRECPTCNGEGVLDWIQFMRVGGT